MRASLESVSSGLPETERTFVKEDGHKGKIKAGKSGMGGFGILPHPLRRTRPTTATASKCPVCVKA